MNRESSVSPETAKHDMDAGNATIVDVREPGEVATLRVPNTRNLPLSALEQRAPELPPGELYVLCASGARARTACNLLKGEGRHASVIEGGIIAWQRAGLPLETGRRRVWPMERQVRFGAGLLVLTGLSLGWWVNAGFFLLSAFVGGGLIFSGVTGICGMAYILARCPWNR